MSYKRVAAFAAAVMLACHGAAGAQTAREERSVSGFDQIVWRTGGELKISQGQREGIIVEAEPRLLPKLLTEVKDGVLEIHFAEGSYSTTQPMRFHVSLKALKSLQHKGSGDIVIDKLDTPSFGLDLYGSGEVSIGRLTTQRMAAKLKGSSSVELAGGHAASQNVEISGSGSYDAASFTTDESTVSIGGSGGVKVSASRSLVARIAGSGQIQYLGSPQVVESISGSGRVRRIGAK